MLSSAIHYISIQYNLNTMQYNIMQCNTILNLLNFALQYNITKIQTLKYNTKQYNIIQYYTIQFNVIQ